MDVVSFLMTQRLFSFSEFSFKAPDDSLEDSEQHRGREGGSCFGSTDVER